MNTAFKPEALVVLNPAAHGGKGKKLWARVAPAVSGRLIPLVVETDPDQRWHAAVRYAVENGIRIFIAAGGDGTVNALGNALLDSRNGHPLEAFTLGAVGLGSSNDYHKPYADRVGGIPLKTNPDAPQMRDVCLARYTADDGSEHQRHFIVSASMGATAEANAFFNSGDRIQRWLKPRWTGGAILYSALATIATYRNIPARLVLDDEEFDSDITNLSVLKTPYLSGSFRFDTPVAKDDGLLSVNLCDGLTRWATLGALADLARGKFMGRPGRRHWQGRTLTVIPERPAALELDGEVTVVRKVSFEVLGERICECH
jgi:diacylglycerol kinase family enzyme